MGELITLYHGTTEDVPKKGEDIFGKVDYKESGLSGNLTDDLECASHKARVRARKVGKKPCVLTFEIPKEMIVDHGPMAFDSAHGFSTKLVVDIKDVPDEFLDRAFLPSKELGVGNNGYLYRIPREFLKEVKNI